MTIRSGIAAAAAIYAGTTPVTAVYAGPDRIWPLAEPITGSWSSRQVPDTSTWTSLATATIPASSTWSVSVTHTWGSSSLQWLSRTRRIRVLHLRGSTVLEVLEERSQNFTTGSWSQTFTTPSRPMVAGDVIRFEGWANDAYVQCRTVSGQWSAAPA